MIVFSVFASLQIRENDVTNEFTIKLGHKFLHASIKYEHWANVWKPAAQGPRPSTRSK